MFAIVMLMELSLVIFALASLVGMTLWLPWLWPAHKTTVIPFMLLEVVLSLGFIYIEPSLWALLFVSVSLYKILNLLRVRRSSMQVEHLHRASLRSGWVLTVAQAAICVLAAVFTLRWSAATAYFLAVTQLITGIVLFSSTLRHLRTTKTLQAITAYTDHELPSLSVLIPARNETDDLQACLAALVASDYPKLEIIVLDDCSQNKYTPEIIKSFAHDGVRFISGQPPSDSWLAKNYAYQQLAEAANGDYLLFCGVDLQMSVGALRELVTTMLEKKKTMISILPTNARPKDLRSYLIQPMRYAWELSLPRRLFNRPPVLSTCWIIQKDALFHAGSFKAACRSITPESHFARSAARHDGYSFLRSNLLVSSKPAAEQQATAVRMRYPQLHRRPELTWLLTMSELTFIILPLPLAVVGFANGQPVIGAIALLAHLLLYAVLLQVNAVMYGRLSAKGLLTAPLAALYDVILLNYSMYRYEFSDVQWKDRNICLPIMRFDKTTAQPVNQE